ncbi:hypothetical protein OG709_00260 [Streptomyces sp. NBC_01267]|uniref:hypothetical protein n=1 Tax=Streptomyces sp. NBC_01267 TaxID=2903805 RepID=UPI002E361905|nr:hypothetical protein [Streptomyces sp. NBC_01267]
MTETHRFTVEYPQVLIRSAEQLALADPESARQHEWTPTGGMTGALALQLLLADSGPAETAERAGEYGLRLDYVALLATDTANGATVYEDNAMGDDTSAC